MWGFGEIFPIFLVCFCLYILFNKINIDIHIKIRIYFPPKFIRLLPQKYFYICATHSSLYKGQIWQPEQQQHKYEFPQILGWLHLDRSRDTDYISLLLCILKLFSKVSYTTCKCYLVRLTHIWPCLVCEVIWGIIHKKFKCNIGER